MKNEDILKRYDVSHDLLKVEPANQTWADNHRDALANENYAKKISSWRRQFISSFNRKKEQWLQDGNQFCFGWSNHVQAIKYGMPVLSLVLGCTGNAQEYYSAYAECLVSKDCPKIKNNWNAPLYPIIRS